MADPSNVSGHREALHARLNHAAVKPGRTWYRLLGPAGQLYAESSDPAEIARFAAESGPGCTTEQSRTFIATTPWESWTPGQEQP